jgi:carbon monoxide dehydrogenase subunit G
MEMRMAQLEASAEIGAAAEAVWALLSDFGAIQRWWPRGGTVEIERVENEGTGVGMIRHIYNKGAVECVSERLELLDPASKSLTLSIVGARPGGITAYIATSTVYATGAASCRIEHRAQVSTVPGREQAVERFLRQAYDQMFRGLEQGASA